MLLETSFFGEAVDKIETQLLTLTNEIALEDSYTNQSPKQQQTKGFLGWQQPRLGIFNVRKVA